MASTRKGKVMIRRQLKRRYVLAFFQKLQPCLVGIEACASSHHWARELQGRRHPRTEHEPNPGAQ
jgi:transposase